MGKETKLKLSASRKDDFAKWYTEVITKSEMIEYYEDVSGCYILRPWSYSIWESIQSWFDKKIKKLGVKPCYFPMFVSQRALETEKDHVEGFAAEVAWVTKSGSSDLENPIAIRPTSETIMYPAFAKWIKSHRDLPLRLNQWTNVVRWEFKNPTPFLRTREFLWQEGHSAFANKCDADVEVLDILDLYSRVYEEVLAVPVIKGRKSEKEKFAGGDFTTTCEAFIAGTGRAIQGATSHGLGQNFSKMFKITYSGNDSHSSTPSNEYVYQNSWGCTTRTIGVMIMTHGDDKGLVLPPLVAPVQVVIIPIYNKKTGGDVVHEIIRRSNEIYKCLSEHEVRCTLDDRADKTSGWKYAHWEQKGVPIRIEVGPRDVESKTFTAVVRFSGEKINAAFNSVHSRVQSLLIAIQKQMLVIARKQRDENIRIAWDMDSFLSALNEGKMILTPWSCTTKSEEEVKALTKVLSRQNAAAENEETNEEGDTRSLTGAAKTLCIPFNQPYLPKGTKCFTGSGNAVCWCLWGRSY